MASVKVEDKGHYELFKTINGNHILVLNDERWFAWVEGQQGKILVHSDSDHEKDHTIQEGEFYFVDFKDDPNYQDTPHLFLQKDDHFEEAILPNGLPTVQDKQKKIVATDETVPQEELTAYLKQ
jgi:hypothetical protein